MVARPLGNSSDEIVLIAIQIQNGAGNWVNQGASYDATYIVYCGRVSDLLQ